MCTFRTHAQSTDAAAINQMVRATAFFSDEEVGIATELINDRQANGDASHYQFVFADSAGGTLMGYACFGRIAGTQASFDLYWIVVHPDHQRSGLGRKLLTVCESRIVQQTHDGAARIYIETSSRDQYIPTRQFYLRCGYRIDAQLDDFYAPGDGKIIFVKSLA